MANTKSAIKRIRRISKQTSVNKIRKSRFRNAIKKMQLIISKKDKKKALEFLPKLNSELMKISKSGIIKKKKCIMKYFKNNQKDKQLITTLSSA